MEAIMLVLSRKKDQQLVIQLGKETVLVRVLDVNGDRVRFGITAPKSVPIHREEVARRIQELQEESSTRLVDAVPQT
jgi:carbon storage regulator